MKKFQISRERHDDLLENCDALCEHFDGVFAMTYVEAITITKGDEHGVLVSVSEDPQGETQTTEHLYDHVASQIENGVLAPLAIKGGMDRLELREAYWCANEAAYREVLSALLERLLQSADYAA